ncbi:MAG TPA: DNA-binding protein WhiA [Gaiellaceae bacterium]|nr:DNA-binding protein WhiA [Gaiellaceae bacterium]
MSLSDELRDELAAIAPRRRCCRLSELSALFHAAGTWHLRGHGSRSLHLDVASAAAARRAFALLRDVGVRSELRTYRRRAFDRATRYQLHVELDRAAAQLLREAGIVGRGGEPLERPPRRVTGRSCCRAAYLRGALLGGSSLSGPRSPHLELRASGRAGAEFVAGVAARDGLPLRVLDRRAGAIAYAKGSETIADLVALAGASETALRLDEHAVVAATRADANRLANADEANVVRTTRAAHAQLQAIRALEGEPLPRKLQEIADLRVRHPYLSLSELATKCRPPISKAAAHHRMAVVRELARRAPAGGEPRTASERGEGQRGSERRAGGEAPRTTSPSG